MKRLPFDPPPTHTRVGDLFRSLLISFAYYERKTRQRAPRARTKPGTEDPGGPDPMKAHGAWIMPHPRILYSPAAELVWPDGP